MLLSGSKNYHHYLSERLPKTGPERGIRSKLAAYLGCQTSFISQVLSGRAHLSLEQGIRVAKFLELGPDERDYFLLLIQRDRAGSKELVEHFDAKLVSKQRTLESVKSQVGKAEKPDEAIASIYYSSWVYSACHILCALPHLSKKDQLRRYLGLSKAGFEKALKFLEANRFVEINGQELRILRPRVHVPDDSPHVAKHHINWRLQAAAQLASLDREGLHFSAIYGISESDALKIKQQLLAAIKSAEKIVGPSREESPFVMLMDFYRFSPTDNESR